MTTYPTPDDVAVAESAQKASFAFNSKWTSMGRGSEFRIDGPDAAARDLGMNPFCEARGQQIITGSYEYVLRKENGGLRIARKKILLLEYVIDGYFDFFTI
jgi:hypothetical protein